MADDDAHTAYGEAGAPEKLSLGRATGGPIAGGDHRPRAEQGDGRPGVGLRDAMVAGRLFMFARNAGNSTLAWSDDHGATWTWADWRFETSMGCPTFLNFGRNHAGARDGFAYAYSFDSDSAYEPADRMVLARAPVERLTQRGAWEWFAGLDAAGTPTWSSDVAVRAGVFEHPGRCYRSGVTWCAPLGRYLWWQAAEGSNAADPDGRFAGGLGVDAPEAWGPGDGTSRSGRRVGESALPAKWMSEDGARCTWSSGDDSLVAGEPGRPAMR